MIIQESTVTFQGKPLFQRAKFKTPIQVAGKMEDMACLFYMVEGSYEVFDLHGAVKIGPTEALLKKCGSYVAHLKEGDWDGIVIFFYPDILHEIYKYESPSFLDKETRTLPPKKMIGNELLYKFINGLNIYFDNPELMDEELALLKMKELILILLKSEHYNNIQQFIADLFTPEKLHFTSAIESNIFSNISIEELAFICHKSLSSFKREFKKVYHETPARYIKERRLQHAAKLLSTTNHSITDIAFESGFQDTTTFSASFREKFNNSPSGYRLTQIGK
ncbi:MAG: AraC family transcriptional regulator [Bacteroidetes bacterium]|nr:MAG: AraC family transcriptional regulator [Bacteroidota bacterium]